MQAHTGLKEIRILKSETSDYGDLALRTNTIYSLTAFVLTAFCVYVFTKLLDKRTIHAGKNAVASFLL